MPRPPQPPRDAEAIRDISEKVYRMRLPKRDLADLLAQQDGAKKLRNRAACYDVMTTSYLKALGMESVITGESAGDQFPEGGDLFGSADEAA